VDVGQVTDDYVQIETGGNDKKGEKDEDRKKKPPEPRTFFSRRL